MRPEGFSVRLWHLNEAAHRANNWGSTGRDRREDQAFSVLALLSFRPIQFQIVWFLILAGRTI